MSEISIKEEWRSRDGYLNYQVSNLGRVRNSTTGRMLKPCINKNGCLHVCLSKNNKQKHGIIHRLVMQEFTNNPENKEFVDHIDHDKTNNCLTNLRWATNSENQMNSIKQRNTNNKYKGVHFEHGRWRVRIKTNGKFKHVGLFDDEKEAARAYNEQAREIYCEYANLNDISDDEVESD